MLIRKLGCASYFGSILLQSTAELKISATFSNDPPCQANCVMLQRCCAEPQDESQDQGKDEEFVEASPAPGGGTLGHIP